MKNKFFKRPNNSWQMVSKWYNKITSDNGHYYHKAIILPKLLNILKFDKNSKIVDLGCGSGILGRNISKDISYLGVDLSRSLINEATRQDKNSNHKYIIGDASNVLLNKNEFTDCVFILSLQNMKHPKLSIKNAVSSLKKGGRIVLVLNHPAFRIPRQSSWEIDKQNKMEYRRINKYMSKMEIPIQMSPSDKNSEFTWSYHYPISEITRMLTENNLLISTIDEWVSDKLSEGKASKMENNARKEFPLFMLIVGVKN